MVWVLNVTDEEKYILGLSGLKFVITREDYLAFVTRIQNGNNGPEEIKKTRGNSRPNPTNTNTHTHKHTHTHTHTNTNPHKRHAQKTHTKDTHKRHTHTHTHTHTKDIHTKKTHTNQRGYICRCNTRARH